MKKRVVGHVRTAVQETGELLQQSGPLACRATTCQMASHSS